jgi:tetratricopeptide (TPR) repeat protein
MDELEFNRALNESAQLLQQNRPGEAEGKLLPLYEATPDHPDVLINLSGAYILQRKWDKAVRLLNKGAKAHPNNPMLWMNLGAAQLGRLETAGPKQQERAIEAFQRAIQVNAETPNAHYQLGLIYKERGELTRAAAFFQRALEVDPADRDARYWLDRLPLLMEAASQAQNAEDSAEHEDGADYEAGSNGDAHNGSNNGTRDMTE